MLAPVIIGIEGTELSRTEAQRIDKLKPAGFILFDRNIESPEQTRSLTDSLRMLCGYNPLIAIDQEGGKVSRLKDIIGPTPSAEQLAQFDRRSVTQFAGSLTGEVLRQLGINWNLAPVLDIHYKGEKSNSLSGRCFGKSSHHITNHAGSFIAGLHDAGVLACGKHFPGMGAANNDPHKDSSVVELSAYQIQNQDMEPFRILAPHLDFIMTAHALYPALAEGIPASLHPDITHANLKRLTGFKGLVITDDMDMGAITKYVDRNRAYEAALFAGNDLVLVCHEMAQVSRDMFPEAGIDISRLPSRRTPPHFSLDAFNRAAKSLNRMCG